MKQDIEQTIKKNLPEKMENCPQCNGLGHTGHSNYGHTDEGECTECPVQCDMCPIQGVIIDYYNKALSQINPSLIADEVLKVVWKKIKQEIPSNLDEVLQLLSPLSPNKENKNNENI